MTNDKAPANADRPAGQIVKPAGLDLKALRESRGLTLREIYERTRVTVVNLEAIETEKFHLLPSPAYAKTFINAYAEAIGIDSKIIFGAYEHYRRSLHVDREEEKDHGRNRIKGKHNRFLIWTALLTFIAGAAMLAFFLQYGGGPDILRTESVKPAGQKTDAAAVEVAQPVQTPVQTEPPPVAEPGKPASPENRQTAEPG